MVDKPKRSNPTFLSPDHLKHANQPLMRACTRITLLKIERHMTRRFLDLARGDPGHEKGFRPPRFGTQNLPTNPGPRTWSHPLERSASGSGSNTAIDVRQVREKKIEPATGARHLVIIHRKRWQWQRAANAVLSNGSMLCTFSLLIKAAAAVAPQVVYVPASFFCVAWPLCL